MSSLFSRRQTRVQQNPKVCKSKKKPKPGPPPPPASASIDLSWFIFDFITFETTSVNVNTQPAVWDGTSWVYTGFDDQGRAYAAFWTYPIGSPGAFEVTIVGFAGGDLVGSSSLNTWDGTLPFSDLAHVITNWSNGAPSGGTSGIRLT